MITSSTNKKIKRVIELRDKAKARNKEGVFVAEGVRLVSEIPSQLIEEVYISQSYEEEFEYSDLRLKLGVKAETVTDDVFKKMADTKTPQGILALVKKPQAKLYDLFNNDKPLVIILENLQDPGNLGTIIRMSEAAGVSMIVMSHDCVDAFSPKVVRATMGSLFRLPLFFTDNLLATMDELQNKGLKIYAAHLKGLSDYSECDYREPSAFVIGNEGNGITEQTAAKCDKLIKIPMAGKVESLNAAIACTVLAYEAFRQRKS